MKLQPQLRPQLLSKNFFQQDTHSLAKSLLGCALIRNFNPSANHSWIGGRIVECEAYTPDDPASHSFNGMTKRNQSMFKEAGFVYVYLIYGFHYCLNIVSEGKGVGAAVLIRALDPLYGIEVMKKNRVKNKKPKIKITTEKLCAGPGNLTAALGIDLNFDGTPLTYSSPQSPQATGNLYLSKLDKLPPYQIEVSPRVGMGKNNPNRNLLARYYVKDSPYLSRKSLIEYK